MKIWINLTYNDMLVDAYERIVHNEDDKSRDITIAIDRLIDSRIEQIISQAKRKLKRELAKEGADAQKPTKPKPRKKKDPTAWRSQSN